MLNDNLNYNVPTVHTHLVESFQNRNGKKRTELGQIIQILEHSRSSSDTIITSIARYSNMSHGIATKLCEKLVNSGLLTRELSGNNKKYRLTSDGISFLNDCRNFGNVLCTYKLNDVLCYY